MLAFAFFLPLIAAAAAASPLAASIKGVPKSAQGKYAGGSFECAPADGGGAFVTVTAAQINDDYCDCADGSDEPGTSACSPSGRFYCVNKKFRGSYISAGRVGDGVCDCCDGSDESAGYCDDTCLAAAAEWQKHRGEEIRRQEEGSRRKAEYVARAAEAMRDLADQSSSLKAAHSTALSELSEAEEKLEEARRVASEAFEPGLEGEDLRVARIDALGLGNFSREQLEDLIVSMVARDSLRDGAMEEIQARSENDDDIEWIPDTSTAGVDDDERVVAAQKNVDARQSAANDIRSDLKTVQDALMGDYGPDNEWWPHKDECFSITSDGYEYKMCPYGEAKQDNKVKLGSWDASSWGHPYDKMVFHNGEKCWNGPKRSLTVELRCAAEEKVLSVREPSMCVYEMVFATPSKCGGLIKPLNLDLGMDDGAGGDRTEL